jgi:CBS domain-containing protein
VDVVGSASLVRDWFTPSPVLTPNTPVAVALRLAADLILPALPVASGTGFIGLVYERDLFRLAPSEATTLDRYELHDVLSRLTVGRLVRPAEGVVVDSPLELAIPVMLRGGVGAVPVLTGRVPVGLLLWTSVLAALSGGKRAA